MNAVVWEVGLIGEIWVSKARTPLKGRWVGASLPLLSILKDSGIKQIKLTLNC